MVTITYRVRNTGNVPIENLRVDDAPGEYVGRADSLEVGASRLFFSRVAVEDVTVSAPRLRYTVPAEGGAEREATLGEARILLADEQLTATLALDRESARVGETVTATLTIMSLGNVSFYDISVYDESYGGLVADALEMAAGAQALTIEREYPVRGDASYQLRVRALSSSGAIVETLTEPVSLRALPAESGAELSLYAEAVYPQIDAAGDVAVDIYITNEGGESARDAVLSETSTATELRAFDFLAGHFTTHRRVYVPVSQSGELTFSLRYMNAAGIERTIESPPVRVEIVRGGQRLDQVAEEEAPFSGQSAKVERRSHLPVHAGRGGGGAGRAGGGAVHHFAQAAAAAAGEAGPTAPPAAGGAGQDQPLYAGEARRAAQGRKGWTDMTFEGYTEQTRTFFMALRFNNNREFFQSERQWYLQSVREPSLALAEALAPDGRGDRPPHGDAAAPGAGPRQPRHALFPRQVALPRPRMDLLPPPGGGAGPRPLLLCRGRRGGRLLRHGRLRPGARAP